MTRNASGETPTRKTTLTKGYWLSRTEVRSPLSKKSWATIPASFRDPICPGNTFLGRSRRVCTAIGGSFRAKPVGIRRRAGTTGGRYGDLDEIAWYYGNSKLSTHPVGKKKPNAFGLYDMLGNVVEWTHTFYWVQHNQENINPTGPSTAEYVELRGGGWWDEAKLLACPPAGTSKKPTSTTTSASAASQNNSDGAGFSLQRVLQHPRRIGG